MIVTFLQKLRTYPELLKKEYPETIKFLHALTDKKGQGTGNMPTNQEACFALEAQKHGFKFEPPTDNGIFIKYQTNGTQASIDFVLIEAVDGVQRTVEFDLKHSNNMTFFWNDGWFKNNVIYIISYTQKKQNKIYIGYGDESYDECDNAAWGTIRSQIKEMNKLTKNTKFLTIYNRLANRYSCSQFTDEFSKERFESIERRLA